jgi:hypothetical protein
MTTIQTDSLKAIITDLKKLGERARSLLDSPDLMLQTPRKTSTEYYRELIQVAASAIAALEDFSKLRPEFIFRDISAERERQDSKFGIARDRDNDPLIWMAVILEELAETAQEIEQ